MTVMATESDHLDAVLVALADAVPYTVQSAKRVQVLPPAYNEVSLEPRAGGALRNARTGRRGYRLAVQSRGRTYEGAQQMREAAFSALLGTELVIGESRSTPLIFESGQPIDDQDSQRSGDDGRLGYYSGLLLFTYTI